MDTTFHGFSDALHPPHPWKIAPSRMRVKLIHGRGMPGEGLSFLVDMAQAREESQAARVDVSPRTAQLGDALEKFPHHPRNVNLVQLTGLSDTILFLNGQFR